MSSYPPETKRYVEEFVFAYLQSLRYSKEMENNYRQITLVIKRKSTKEIKKVARKMTKYLLEHINDSDELNDVGDQLLSEALLFAANEND